MYSSIKIYFQNLSKSLGQSIDERCSSYFSCKVLCFKNISFTWNVTKITKSYKCKYFSFLKIEYKSWEFCFWHFYLKKPHIKCQWNLHLIKTAMISRESLPTPWIIWTEKKIKLISVETTFNTTWLNRKNEQVKTLISSGFCKFKLN